MANVAVIGPSPVTFTSEDSGQQIQIPLSALTYDTAKGTIDASAWAPSKKLGSKDTALLPLLLADLLKRGVLSAPST